MAVKIYKAGQYKTLKKVSLIWKALYWTVYNQLNGNTPRLKNGGKNTKLTETEELAMKVWFNINIFISIISSIPPIIIIN